MLTVFHGYQHVAELIHKVTHVVDNPPETGNHEELPLESARSSSEDPRAELGME